MVGLCDQIAQGNRPGTETEAHAAGPAVCTAISPSNPRDVIMEWHSEVDVVVIGAGAAGVPAAIAAREAGSTVILLEAQPHLGGHAITSGGNVPLGGGTS